MRLTIDLTETEAANIAGWANHYTAHPEQTPTRIVLEDRSPERLRAIAAQFGAAPPLPEPGNAPGGQPPAPVPTPTPPAGPVPYQSLLLTWGDFSRQVVSNFREQTVVCNFTVPSEVTRTRLGYCAMAEWNGQPWGRQMSLSEQPGDFTNVLALTAGSVPNLYFGVNTGDPLVPNLVPGRTYYFNFRNERVKPSEETPNGLPMYSIDASFSVLWPPTL